MTTLSSYLVTCLTEGIRVVSDYRESAPTQCPNNSAHTIDPSQTSIYRTIGTEQTTIVDPINGYYQITTIKINIPAGDAGDKTIHNEVWPTDIIMWGMTVYFDSGSAGDVFDIIHGPDTAVGVATSTVSVSSTVIPVSTTVLANVLRGLDVALSDGVHYNDLGRVTALDVENNTITVENATTNEFAPGSYVLLNIKTVKNFQIETCLICPNGTTFGNRLLIGKAISAGLVMRLIYTNNTATAKDIVCKLEYSIAG